LRELDFKDDGESEREQRCGSWISKTTARATTGNPPSKLLSKRFPKTFRRDALIQAPRMCSTKLFDKTARRVHLNSMLIVLNHALHPTPTTEIQVAGSPTSVGAKVGVLCNVEVSEGPA
jgi:hypothetical protein